MRISYNKVYTFRAGFFSMESASQTTFMIFDLYVIIRGIVWDDPMLQERNRLTNWHLKPLRLTSSWVGVLRLCDQWEVGRGLSNLFFFWRSGHEPCHDRSMIPLAVYCESHHPISCWISRLTRALQCSFWSGLGPAGHELGGGAFAEVRTSTIGGIGLQFTICAKFHKLLNIHVCDIQLCRFVITALAGHWASPPFGPRFWTVGPVERGSCVCISIFLKPRFCCTTGYDGISIRGPFKPANRFFGFSTSGARRTMQWRLWWPCDL